MYFGLQKWKVDSANRSPAEQQLIDAALAQVGDRKLAFSTGWTRVFGHGDDQREIALIISGDEIEVVADSPRLPKDVLVMARPNFGNARTARLLERAQWLVYSDLELRNQFGDPAKLPI